MGARSSGEVLIKFGLMPIKCKLYLSSDSSTESIFNQLSPHSHKRIVQKNHDPISDKVIESKDLIKGYCIKKSKNRLEEEFVVFTQEEISELESDKQIEISEFIDFDHVDLLQIDRTLYLQPEDDVVNEYAILAEAMRQGNLAAVGIWVGKSREHLVAIRAYKHGLVMHQLHFSNKLRTFDDKTEGIEVEQEDVDLALQIIDRLKSDDWDPSQYRDSYKDRVLNAVKQKQDGGTISVPTRQEVKQKKKLSVREMLKAQLDVTDSKGAPKKAPPKKKAAAKKMSRKAS
jgi:DNA end-binding protein Ku